MYDIVNNDFEQKNVSGNLSEYIDLVQINFKELIMFVTITKKERNVTRKKLLRLL